jgi:hypothetical protein
MMYANKANWRACDQEMQGDVRMRTKVEVLILLMVVAALVLPGPGSAQVETRDIEFPYVLRIVEGNVLFVHGHRCRDSVVVTWEPGDSVRINGMAVLPARPTPPRVPSDADLMRAFGEVPFVVARVENGATWQAAADEYEGRMHKSIGTATERFWQVFDSTGSYKQAGEAAVASMDWSLLDPEKETKMIGEKMMIVNWEGLLPDMRLDLSERPLKGPFPKREATYRKAAGLVRRIGPPLDGTYGTRWLVVLRYGGELITSGEDVEKALRQVDMARNGKYIKGPLTDGEVTEILQAEGGD